MKSYLINTLIGIFLFTSCYPINHSNSGSKSNANLNTSNNGNDIDILTTDTSQVSFRNQRSRKLLEEDREDSVRGRTREEQRRQVRQGRVESFHESYEKRNYIGRSTIKQTMWRVSTNIESSYSLMGFGQNIGALLSMYEVTDSIGYLHEAANLVSQITSSTQLGKDIANNPSGFKDDYRGWVNYNPEGKHSGAHLQEIPLFESRFLRYVSKMVYLILTSREIKENNVALYDQANTILEFLETHGWEKWYVRGEKNAAGCYPYLFRNRTHMGSHWAIVALYLRELTVNQLKRQQYSDFLEQYDLQLKDNFRVQDHNAYMWHSTWDSPWPYNSQCYPAATKSIIQDVDHGNHVVAYVVESYEVNNGKGVWKNDDIQKLVNTVKYVLYDEQGTRFYADLNQKVSAEFADGVRMADGFVSLARFDKDLFNLFEKVQSKQYTSDRFRYLEPQYLAELALAEQYLLQ